jgi:hypothetical protein
MEGGGSTEIRKIIFYLAMLWFLYNILKEIYKLRYWKCDLISYTVCSKFLSYALKLRCE